MAKVIITGGAGFIGSNLAYFLTKKGHEVTVIDNFSYGYKENLMRDEKIFCEIIEADIRNPDILQYFKDKDYVFHMAAISNLPTCQSNPGEAISVNVGGTANVLECARLAGVKKVIFASTNALYEDNLEPPFREDMNIDPFLTYSISKYLCEQICRAFKRNYEMNIVITRYHNVYGPHQDSKRKSPALTVYLIRELLNNRVPVLHSDGNQRRAYTFIDDVNEMNLLCMEREEANDEIFNVSSKDTYSVNEIYSKIAKQLNSDIIPKFNKSDKLWDDYTILFEGKYPLKKELVEKEVNKMTLGDAKKARLILGWEAKTSMDDGIKIMIDSVMKSQQI